MIFVSNGTWLVLKGDESCGYMDAGDICLVLEVGVLEDKTNIALSRSLVIHPTYGLVMTFTDHTRGIILQ